MTVPPAGDNQPLEASPESPSRDRAQDIPETPEEEKLTTNTAEREQPPSNNDWSMMVNLGNSQEVDNNNNGHMNGGNHDTTKDTVSNPLNSQLDLGQTIA